MSTFTNDGLYIDDLNTIIEDLRLKIISVLGANANIDPNSPDGMIIAYAAQVARFSLERIRDVYTAIDIDRAGGDALDRLCRLCGLTRRGETRSLVNVTLTLDQDLSLIGYNESPTDCEKVSSINGDVWCLLNSTRLLAGTHTVAFMAEQAGPIYAAPHTITKEISGVSHITAVDNVYPNATTGTTEETDIELRRRQQVSSSAGAQGIHDALVADLMALPTVIDCKVYENVTAVHDDVKNMDAHSIWVVLTGGYTEDVANTIASHLTGCGMKGSQSYDYVFSDGQVAAILWDYSAQTPLYISLDLDKLDPSLTIDIPAIKSYLINNLTFKINSTIDSTTITRLVKNFDNNLVVITSQVSLDGNTWTDIATPLEYNGVFVLEDTNINVTGT
jgi:uncharacterized phage protein gp47/JayE